MTSMGKEKLQIAALAALVVATHVVWFGRYGGVALGPDQGGYLEAGRAILRAVGQGSAVTSAVLENARRWLDFAGVGLFYGVIDALWPDDTEALRWCLAALQLLSVIGAYQLARTLHSRLAAGLAGLWCALSPAFPAHAAYLYPDPLTAALLTWGLVFYCRATSWRGFVGVGLLLGGALFVRVQLLPWALSLAFLAAVLSASGWLRSADGRRRVLGTGLGLALVGIVWAGVTAYSLPALDSRAPKHNLARYQYYPYGVWQYAETDGWEGPYRLKAEPFYAALTAAAEQEPALRSSRARQYGFVAQYMWARRGEFALLILDNAYRMWDRPINPEHRPFPLPLPLQKAVHRAAVIAALLGVVVVNGRGLWLLPVCLVPLGLTALHAMAYPWPRYVAPILPIVMALAGVGAAEAWARRREVPRWRALGVTASLAGLAVGACLLMDARPEAARWISALAVTLVTAAPFAWGYSWLKARPPRWSATLLGGVAVAAVAAHEARSASWHERAVWLEQGGALRQTIALGSEALEGLRVAREAYLTIDLELTEPDSAGLRVLLNGHDVTTRLEPMMPDVREVIPDSQAALVYPQWWAVALTTDEVADLAARGQAQVEVAVVSGAPAKVKADRFTGQDAVYEGPSWGEWPHAVGLKPQYDREYRLYVRRSLSSSWSKAEVRLSAWEPLRSALRIRIVALADVVGTVAWEMGRLSERAHENAPVVAVFSAQSGVRKRGFAELSVNRRLVADLPVGAYGDYLVSGPGGRICYLNRTRRSRGDWTAAGVYAVETVAGAPLEMQVAFRPGMSDRPMMFGLEGRQPSAQEAIAAAEKCGLSGEVALGPQNLRTRGNSYPDDLGRWRVESIY